MTAAAGRRGPPRTGPAVLSFCLALALLFTGCARREADRNRMAALKMADFILSVQLENGAIPDAPGADTVNEDSDMEYALTALAAACQETGQKKYLAGLEKGIAWLAAAEDMDDGPWRGSWWYRYDRTGGRAAAPQGGGVEDVRGVDAASALFVYLLYLHGQCAGSSALADRYRENAEAALNFLLTGSRTEEGFFASSFQMDAAGRWSRYDCCYSADQGDVWLGLRAGALLYGYAGCAEAADFLREETPETFFSVERGRYCIGLEDGRQDWSEDGFGPEQSQGYLPWLWGDSEQNRAAVGWLREKMAGDRSAEYSLTAAFLLLGESGLGGTPSADAADWLLRTGADEAGGGVFDSPRDRTQTVNTAAFCALALLGWRPGV